MLNATFHTEFLNRLKKREKGKKHTHTDIHAHSDEEIGMASVELCGILPAPRRMDSCQWVREEWTSKGGHRFQIEGVAWAYLNFRS